MIINFKKAAQLISGTMRIKRMDNADIRRRNEWNCYMAEEDDIPFPVRFNPSKHHRNYMLSLLKSSSPNVISSLPDPICNNCIDIYTGAMTPGAIGHAVISILKSNHVLRTGDFTEWVAKKNGYRQITLEDRSEWIVRKSNESERYIHLHPARTGPLIIRFKGSTLKTVYQMKAQYPDCQVIPSVEMVNRVRLSIGLSPVKKLDRNKGILYCYANFF